MTDFKEHWNLEMALEVAASETVNGRVWSEAVKWLLLYGPPQLREMLGQASGSAFDQCIPGVRPQGYNDAGQAYYGINELAEALGVPVDEAAQRLVELDEAVGLELLVDGARVYKVH